MLCEQPGVEGCEGREAAEGTGDEEVEVDVFEGERGEDDGYFGGCEEVSGVEWADGDGGLEEVCRVL